MENKNVSKALKFDDLSAFDFMGFFKKAPKNQRKSDKIETKAQNLFYGRGKSRNELIQNILFDSFDSFLHFFYRAKWGYFRSSSRPDS